MGFLDKLKVTANEVKVKAVDAVDGHAPQIKGGIEKAGAFADQKTKGKYADKIAQGTKKAGEAIDKIDRDADKKDKPPTAPKPAQSNPAQPTQPESRQPGHKKPTTPA